MPGDIDAVRPDDSPTVASNSRRLDIQGLRAIAVLVVVAFHCGLPVPGGFIGVDVFFVISGFVITGMLHREWQATGRLRFGQFYLRRFQRLTPALALMIATVTVASVFVLSPFGPQQNTAMTGIGAMLLIANFVIERTTGGYFDVSAETNPLLNTWSLSVEEQFYLVFPALIALCWYLARRRGLLRFSPFAIVGSIALVSLTLAVIGSLGFTFRGSEAILGFYSPFTRAWEFAAGALLALALANRSPKRPRLLAAVGVAGLLLLVVGLWIITSKTPFPGPWTLLPVTAALFLLLAGTDATTPTYRLLSTRPSVKLGDWSYSVYLWHWPLIVFASLIWPGEPTVLVIAAVVSLAPAVASYHWVEQPIRNLRCLDAQRWTKLIVTTILAPVTLAAGLGFAVTQGWWNDQVRQLQPAHAPTDLGCFSTGPFDPDYFDACTWNAGAPGEPIYLVGDSNAWQFAEAAIYAGTALDRPVSVVTTPSCPFVDSVFPRVVSESQYLPDPNQPNSFDHCPAYMSSTLAWLESSPPGVVIIAGIDQYWWDPAIGVALGNSQVLSTETRKLSALRASLIATVRGLQQSGHSAILVQSIPTYRNPLPIWDPAKCSMTVIVAGNCAKSSTLTTLNEIQGPSRSVIEEVAEITGSTALDPRPFFCTSDECSTERGGKSIYRDATHITVDASWQLGREFVKVLQRAS